MNKTQPYSKSNISINKYNNYSQLHANTNTIQRQNNYKRLQKTTHNNNTLQAATRQLQHTTNYLQTITNYYSTATTTTNIQHTTHANKQPHYQHTKLNQHKNNTLHTTIKTQLLLRTSTTN